MWDRKQFTTILKTPAVGVLLSLKWLSETEKNVFKQMECCLHDMFNKNNDSFTRCQSVDTESAAKLSLTMDFIRFPAMSDRF